MFFGTVHRSEAYDGCLKGKEMMTTIGNIQKTTIRFEYYRRKEITISGEKVIDLKVTDIPGKSGVALCWL